MAVIANKQRIGSEAKLRIGTKRVNGFIENFNKTATATASPSHALSDFDETVIHVGKPVRTINIDAWQWVDESEWEDIQDLWNNDNEELLVLYEPQGENLPCPIRMIHCVPTGFSETTPRDEKITVNMTASQSSAFSGYFNFTDANSTLPNGGWLWTANNSNLALEQHRTAVSEPHFSARTLTGLDADTKKIAIIYTFKGISGFDTTFVTENDNNWQLGFYDSAEPAGQTFFEPITEYRRITTSTHQEVLIVDPPARLANNHLAFKLDMSAIRNPPHQTYAVDFRFQVSFALL